MVLKSESFVGNGRESVDPAERGDALDAIRNIFLLLLVSWLLVASAYSGAVSPTSGITGMDFAAFYHAGERMSAGQPLYQPHLNPALHGSMYVYSPLLALLIRPLSHLPFHAAITVWFFVNAAFQILAVLLYGAAARLTWRDAPSLAVLLLVSFRFWDTTMNFGLGQSNCIMLGLIGAMLWADSRKKWGLMAAVIAFAALFKIWLIGIVLFLLLRRRWKEAFLSVGLFLAALGSLFAVVGWSELPDFLRCLMQASAFGKIHSVMNSVIGFADLHLHSNPLVTPLVDSRIVYIGFIALCAAGLAWGFILLWHTLRDPSPLEIRLSFGLTLTSILLMLPSYENGYLVYCFPLLWTLLAVPGGADKRPAGVSRLMLVGGILIYLVSSRAWPVYAPFAPSYQHGLRSLIVSMGFYSTAALWGIGFYCLNKMRSLKNTIPAQQIISG